MMINELRKRKRKKLINISKRKKERKTTKNSEN